MSWYEALGPISGLLGLTVAVINALISRRGQEHTERTDDERLGHAELVAALEVQRAQISDLRAEVKSEREQHDATRKHYEEEVTRWRGTAEKKDQQLNDLLWTLERRRDG